MLSKKDKQQYMKKYNKAYQRALKILRDLHKLEFCKILRGLMKGGSNNGKN